MRVDRMGSRAGMAEEAEELATELAAVDPGGSGRIYLERDISFVIREAAWYLVETTVNGYATFRLYHQAIADALRNELLDAN